MLRSKKFQINNFLKIFAIVFFITNTLLLSQEKNYSLKIQSNPINSDYWWLEKNNFGIKSQNIHFQVKWK